MCPYSKDESSVLYKKLKCEITGKICEFWRFCSEKNKPVMSSFYYKYGCKIKEDFEKKE